MMRRREKERRLPRRRRPVSAPARDTSSTDSCESNNTKTIASLSTYAPGRKSFPGSMPTANTRTVAGSVSTITAKTVPGGRGARGGDVLNGVRFNDRVRVRFIPTRVEMASDGYLADCCWNANDFRSFRDDFLRRARAAGIVARGGGACMLRVRAPALFLTVESASDDAESDSETDLNQDFDTFGESTPSESAGGSAAPCTGGGDKCGVEIFPPGDRAKEILKQSEDGVTNGTPAIWFGRDISPSSPASLLPRSSVSSSLQRGSPVRLDDQHDAPGTVIPRAVAPVSTRRRFIMPWERRDSPPSQGGLVGIET